MKKHCLLFCFMMIGLVATAQVPKHAVLLSFSSGNFTSYSPNAGLIYRITKADSSSLRLGITSSITINVPVNSFQEGYSITENANFWSAGISIGKQKNFKTITRIKPYYGADIVANYANSNSHKVQTVINPKLTLDSNDNPGDVLTTDRKNITRLGTGFIPFIGADLPIGPNFIVGAEFGYGLILSWSLPVETTTKYRSATGFDYQPITSRSYSSFEGHLGSTSSGMIHVGWRF